MFTKNQKDHMLAAAAGAVGSLVVAFVYDHRIRNLKIDHKIELEEAKEQWHHHGWEGGIEFGTCICPVEHYPFCNSHPSMIEARKKKD